MDRFDEDLAQVGAVFLEDRKLRRVIKRDRNIPGPGLRVPHAHCYAVSRAALRRFLMVGERPPNIDALPEQLLLIGGDRVALAPATPEARNLVWRTLFHARVHQALDELLARKALTPAMVRERINRIGQTEFDEVRFVLQQEDLVLPPADDPTVYTEFVALWLEQQHFAPTALAQTFPILHGATHVDATIALDVDGAALLEASRPPGAPAAPIPFAAALDEAVHRPPEENVGYGAVRAARGAASYARKQGNHARAAIMSARAGELDTARKDLDALVERLARALGVPPGASWASALLPVAHHTAGKAVLRFTAGARLLHDLQAACVDAEREQKVVDPVTYALSLRKQPIVRPLPATREVRVARHLRDAAKKIARCELGSAEERDRLSEAVRAMVERANDNVRAVVRPRIEEVFDDVQLEPRHLPEKVAQKKIVDELLDHAVTVGRLSIGNLRDAIAHNDLKLPDLRPTQLVTGDQLLKADKILAKSLDGVYRRGEIYMRFLQKVSSVLSGMALGRLLTLYVLLPLVGSFFLVEGLHHMIGPAMKVAGYAEPHLSTRTNLLAVAGLVFLLLHVPPFRRGLLEVAKAVGRGLRFAFVTVPCHLWKMPGVPAACRWGLFPLLPALLVWLLIPGWLAWPFAILVFAGVAAVINASLVEEMVSDWLLRSGRHVMRRVIPGLVRYALELFSWLIELLERFIYRVDEALRFRPNQSQVVVVVKGVVFTIWFVISYVLRIYVNLLIEPTVNPIKHFPVVTVAAKVILPFIPQMTTAIAGWTEPVLGTALATSFAAFTILVLPGIAGFLAWELNSNWKLYRNTRRTNLEQVRIGSHGETMVRFMKPGFHSGTIPKLHAKLRRATWKGDERAAAHHKEALHHVDEAIHKFADRQVVSMLNEAPAFRAIDVAVEHVDVGSNRVRITLVCPSVAAAPATIGFELQSGWLVAGIATTGWLDALDDEQRRVFEIALAGFYKLSGVDIVREQLEDVIGRGTPYDVSDEGLVVWPGPGFETEIVYDLRGIFLTASFRGAPFTGEAPTLRGKHALFGREPLRWAVWEKTWEQLGFGMDPKPMIVGPGLLPRPAEKAPAGERVTA